MSHVPDARSEARSRAFLHIWIAYLTAGIAALLVGIAVAGAHPIAVVFAADVAATLVIFAFSVVFKNSSVYDAYWSVVPPLIAIYWSLAPDPGDPEPARQVLVVAVVTLWAVRLTHNWARGWSGLDHEDWRYVDIRTRTGALYWPASFVAIHALPTGLVFLGCLPLFPALASGGRPLGWIDAVAAGVAVAGIALEFFADNELRRFRLSDPPREAILDRGLWGWSRHPNYLGEILFWWGLALFGLAAQGFVWWGWVGAVAITALFRFASLPLIESRMLERRPGFVAHQQRVPLLIPRPSRPRRSS